MHLHVIPAILEQERDALSEKIQRSLRDFDIVQIDVMDGIFVPNTTYNDIVHFPFPEKEKSLELHLMVANPEKAIRDWAVHPSVFRVIPHREAFDDASLRRSIDFCKAKGLAFGLAINPATPYRDIMPYIDMLAMVLVMGVVPGFSAQKFHPEIVDTIHLLKEAKPKMPIEVDGGVNMDTIEAIAFAGASMYVTASYLYAASDMRKAADDLLAKAKNVYTG